ncbi:hypothetical protein [Alkaliphilus sp. B6464]|uniref:hypothetical protein n=1 Tax=Alkaliphilus sp. B6464 TaxID=2731219 RepID=UPI001BA8ED6B|nr:hypothetical protein [Alkaliphilus sp. B6464]QUH21862.1 hypothetical protein HYG84_18165 [Alkaliphilus sp. B6464]
MEIDKIEFDSGFVKHRLSINKEDNTLYLTNITQSGSPSSSIGLELTKGELKNYIDLLNIMYSRLS